MLKELIISMRPKQWYKNLIIFMGIIFSMNFLNVQMWIKLLYVFIIFCMLSGSEYIINDVFDREKDRKHPKKSKRPIASGKLKIFPAISFAIILIILAIWWAFSINKMFVIISLSYLFLVFFYSLVLKNIIIVDILTISIGFVIRAMAGCLAISVFISPWLIICTFLVAMFLAIGKRRYEVFSLGVEAKKHRKILENYSVEMLDQLFNITTGVLITAYSLYTFLTNNKYMMLTIPFVIYGLFRYLSLANKKDVWGEPEILFKDKGIITSIILWIILIIFILYFGA